MIWTHGCDRVPLSLIYNIKGLKEPGDIHGSIRYYVDLSYIAYVADLLYTL